MTSETQSPILRLVEQIKQEVIRELKAEREHDLQNDTDEGESERNKKRKDSLQELIEEERRKKEKIEKKRRKNEEKHQEIKKRFQRLILDFQIENGQLQNKDRVIPEIIKLSFYAKSGVKILDKPFKNNILGNIAEISSDLDETNFSQLLIFFLPYFKEEKEIKFSKEGSPTQFEEDLKLLAESNKILAYKIKTLIEKSYTNIADFDGLAKNILLKKIDDLLSPQLEKGQISDVMTDEEQSRLRLYQQKIRDLIEEKAKTDPSRDYELEINQAIGRNDKDQLTRILNWSEDQIDDYLKLNKKAIGLIETKNFIEQAMRYGYSFNQEDVEFLSASFWTNSFDQLFRYDGTKYVLNKNGIEALRTKSIFLLTKLLNRIDPEQEWQRGWSEFTEGALFRSIIGHLYQLIDIPSLRAKLNQESLLEFQREIEKTVNLLHVELTARELYHEMRRYIVLGIATPKDMANFMRRFPASRLTYFLESWDGDIIEEVRSIFESMMQFKIAANNNIIDSGIFETFFDTPNSAMKTEYYEKVRDLVFKRLKEKYGSDVNLLELDWRIKRAMILGMGFSFATSARLPAILAMAEPSPNFKGQPFIVQFFNLRHRWRLGRGGESIFLYPEFFDLEVVWSPDLKPESLLKRLIKPWRPKSVYKGKAEKIDVIIRELMEEINDKLGYFDIDEVSEKRKKYKPEPIRIKIRDQLRSFVLPDFISRLGWRIDPFKEYIAEQYGIPLSELANFNKVFPYIMKYVGVGALWLLDGDRISQEIAKIIPESFFGKDYKLFLDPEYITKIMNSLTLYQGESANKLLEFEDLDGNKINMTVSRFIMEKGLHLRGMHFLELLRRSPLDFLTIMLQLEPWLADIITTKHGQQITAFEYFFADATQFAKFSRSDQKIIREKLEKLEKKWGLKNLKHIKRVAKFFHDYYRTEVVLNRKMMLDRLFNELSLSRSRVMEGNKLTMEENDVSDKVLRELLFADDGLIAYFNKLGERFAETDSDFGKLGDRGFFYKMAERWFLIEKIGLIPSLSETKMGPIFHRIEKLGIDPFARKWSDQAAFDEAEQGMTSFDLLIKEVSSHRDWKIMFEKFHSQIHKIQGALGLKEAQRLQAVLIYGWVRYFQTHYIDRLPFPLNLTSVFLGKNVSLSTLKDGWLGYQLKDEDIKQIILYATEQGFIGEEHKEWLEKALGVGLEFYAPKILITVLILMLIVMLYQSAKKGYKEEMEKKGN